ncbi:unnamed protein product [Lepeophtheirus salmonis]|uniref:(salmon louse) hypothetical protein n=1 Tax=Lepeophtheirus salmonis TaxID=72036 RepID=A0A7R8CAS5_LEPSM|nr:unnamed protein product [Lepeophtheirus salmonis]CAF2752589.1 unnamed protein product [Lepeophtheirus salmonis]
MPSSTTETSTSIGGPTPLGEEYGWHEDNIQIDFMTVNDLERLLAKNGHKLEGSIYRESVTLVASMVEDSTTSTTTTASPLLRASSTLSSSSSASATPSYTSSSNLFFTSLSPSQSPPSSSNSFNNIVANTFQGTGSFDDSSSPSAPTPLTLSLGSWSISEEEFPLYIGSAAGIILLLFLLLSATMWRCLTASDRKRQRRREDLEKRMNSPSLLSSNSAAHVHHISSHDSMVCLSGSRIESRIIDPYISKEDIPERNCLLSTPKKRGCIQGSRIVTDVDDVIGSGLGNYSSSPLDDMNTYVKLAPVVDNFLASQATFHTFQPSQRLSKKQSLDGMSSSKTSPNELDMDDSLTAAEAAELQEEARDSFHSLPFSRRSDLYNGNLASLGGVQTSFGISSSNDNREHPGQPPMDHISNNNNAVPASTPFHSSNQLIHAQSSTPTTFEDLYAKVDYNSKLKNRYPQDGCCSRESSSSKSTSSSPFSTSPYCSPVPKSKPPQLFKTANLSL